MTLAAYFNSPPEDACVEIMRLILPALHNSLPERLPGKRSRIKCHQLVVDELIRFRTDSEIAPERAVEGEDHENDQSHERGEENDQNCVQARILDLEKEG